jgi:hypothetical protein
VQGKIFIQITCFFYIDLEKRRMNVVGSKIIIDCIVPSDL